MKRKKEDFFVIALGLLLVIIIFMIAILSINFSKNVGQEQSEEKISASPTIAETNKSPSVLYDSAAQDKLVERIKNRQPLSDEDRLAKARILSVLPSNNASGVVYQTQNIRIDYTKAADLIQVEILTTDIRQAKTEANLWLRSQGLSQDAICELPIGFYLNYEVANELRDTISAFIFNPLGNSC